MKFEDMNEMQRRLHNAALVLDADGDEWGFVGMIREAIGELERLKTEVSDLRDTVRTAYDVATEHDERLPFEWGLYCEMLYRALQHPETVGPAYALGADDLEANTSSNA